MFWFEGKPALQFADVRLRIMPAALKCVEARTRRGTIEFFEQRLASLSKLAYSKAVFKHRDALGRCRLARHHTPKIIQHFLH